MDGGHIVGIIAVSIPIVALIGGFTVAILKARYKAKATAIGSEEVHQLTSRLNQLEEENAELKKRVNNVETIVTDENFHIQLPPAEQNLDQQIETLMKQKDKLKR